MVIHIVLGDLDIIIMCWVDLRKAKFPGSDLIFGTGLRGWEHLKKHPAFILRSRAGIWLLPSLACLSQSQGLAITHRRALCLWSLIHKWNSLFLPSTPTLLYPEQ